MKGSISIYLSIYLSISISISIYIYTVTSGQITHDTQNAQISQKYDGRNIYAIMKIMCPPGNHHNSFVATHALWHMMYGYTLLVPMNQRVLNNNL